jgi:DNA-directed RNA polymerase specialized sigma24 family protein
LQHEVVFRSDDPVTLSDEEYREVVAQLRHRLGAYKKGHPKLFRGWDVDDVIGEAFVKYFRSKQRIDERIDAYPAPKRLETFVALLCLICRGKLIDQWRKLRREVALPGHIESWFHLAHNPLKTYHFDQLLCELIDSLDSEEDKRYWRSFRRLAEGPIVTPNREVAEDLNVAVGKVVSFKLSARRMLREVIGKCL